MKISLVTIGLSMVLISTILSGLGSIGPLSASQISDSKTLASSMPSSRNQKQQLIVQAANLEVMEAMELAIYRQGSPRIKSIKSQQKIVAQKLRKIDQTDKSKQIRIVRNRIINQEVTSLEKQIKTRSLKFSQDSPQITVLREQIINLRKLIS